MCLSNCLPFIVRSMPRVDHVCMWRHCSFENCLLQKRDQSLIMQYYKQTLKPHIVDCSLSFCLFCFPRWGILKMLPVLLGAILCRKMVNWNRNDFLKFIRVKKKLKKIKYIIIIKAAATIPMRVFATSFSFSKRPLCNEYDAKNSNHRMLEITVRYIHTHTLIPSHTN